MGYKEELSRQFSGFELFAIAFSITGLIPSIASGLSFAILLGPVGLVWVSRTTSMVLTMIVLTVLLGMVHRTCICNDSGLRFSTMTQCLPHLKTSA